MTLSRTKRAETLCAGEVSSSSFGSSQWLNYSSQPFMILSHESQISCCQLKRAPATATFLTSESHDIFHPSIMSEPHCMHFHDIVLTDRPDMHPLGDQTCTN